MSDLFDLTGKVAVVTGGSRMGREWSWRSHNTVQMLSSLRERLMLVKNSLTKFEKPQVVRHYQLGAMSVTGSSDELRDTVYKEFGRYDVLVNNAGLSPLYPSLYDVTEDLYSKVMDVNLKGPFRLSAVFGKHMFDGDGGSIINVSSVAAMEPTPNEPGMALQKGRHAITKSLLENMDRKSE